MHYEVVAVVFASPHDMTLNWSFGLNVLFKRKEKESDWVRVMIFLLIISMLCFSLFWSNKGW